MFKDYYEHYLSLHQKKWCRRMHFLGQTLTLVYMCFCLYKFFIVGLLFAPFIVYPFAWFGHYMFEKNKPAAFSNPLFAKACDWVMYKDIIIGKIPF